MKDSPQQPAPPDPNKVAGAQAGANVFSGVANTILSNADQVGPSGTTTSRQTGMFSLKGPNGETYEIPRFTQTTTLSPTEQRLYDQQSGIKAGMNTLAGNQVNFLTDHLGRPMNANGLPGRGTLPTGAPTSRGLPVGPRFQNATAGGPLGQADTTFGASGPIQTSVNQDRVGTTFADVGGQRREVGPHDYEDARKGVEEAIYSRVNPQLERDYAALETRLVNQGFARGSEAFKEAMNEHGRTANDARMQAVLAGGQEQSRLAGLDFQDFELENAAQQRDYDQAYGRGMYDLTATDQNNRSALNAGTFANAAQKQGYDEELGRGTFARDSVAANNATQGQEFQQMLDRLGFNNANVRSSYEDAVRRQTYADDQGQRRFANETSLAQAQDDQRGREFQIAKALRDQPINEISSLLHGGQVTMPQFTPFSGGKINDTPIGDYTYNSAGLANQNYAQQMQQQNALYGAIAGLGGAGLYGLAGGKFGNPTSWFGGGAQA